MQKRTPPRVLFFSILAIGLTVGFFGGLVFGRSGASFEKSGDLGKFEKIFSKEPTFDLINEGVDIINRKYVDGEKVKNKDLIYGAMEGMVNVLGDPYSIFFQPKASKVFEENVNGAFGGIGAEIGMREGVLTVISPLKDSPAERAGLKAGDRVLFVDDTDTKGLSLDEAVQIIRGKKKTRVVLTISREDVEDVLKIPIIRDTIKIPSIKVEDKGDGIMYIALYQFSEKASGDFKDAVSEVLKSNENKIILDLRNNPGGFLEVAVDIAGWFLGPDKVVVTEDHAGREENRIYTSHGSGALADFPVVVLVNGGSASASEILAGALRDHAGVQLVGETTFGKGSVQELIKLSDGSSIKITIAKWLTPSGLSIQDNGLTPDVTVKMTQEIFNEQGDVQLLKAIEMLKGL